MNRILKLTLLLSAMVAIMISTGCKGWLDIPLEATEPADAVDYTEPAGADNLLAGCYSIVRPIRRTLPNFMSSTIVLPVHSGRWEMPGMTSIGPSSR